MARLLFGAQTVSELSTEWVVAVAQTEIDLESLTYMDPVTIEGTIEWAFLPEGNPNESDWVSGSVQVLHAEYAASCLIGPEGVKQLSPGLYEAWVRITNPPEKSVQKVGSLNIY